MFKPGASRLWEGHIPSVDSLADDTDATRLVVEPGTGGQRLDQFLARALDGALSRARVQALIAQGMVLLNGAVATQPSRKINEGDQIEIELPEAEDADPVPENIPLRILFEDEALIVVDKPAGLVVHPGPGNWTGTLVNALLFHCGDTLSGIGGVKRPGIVHRLDRDTSGVMVVAKNDLAHRSLAEQFAAHGRDGRMEREYLALVWGVPERPAGVVDAPLGRSSTDRTKRAVVPAGRSDAREARTAFEVAERFVFDGEVLACSMRCRLETGRTHQIRVHMAHIGHPLLGDETYGAGFRSKARRLPEAASAVLGRFHRQALHAARLGFLHPASGERMSFEASPPADMAELLDSLRH